MIKQDLTDFDINLDATGPNSPYTVSWSSSFNQKDLSFSFTVSPILLGGVNENIRLQTINVQKFKSENDIPVVHSQLFNFEVPGLPASESTQAGGSGASYMFIVIMFLSIGVSLATGGSIELMWSLANTLQILFYYGMLDLYYPPELLAVFSYMGYSNFDNPVFEFIRAEASKTVSFIHATVPSGFQELGFSSSSILVNFLDKLILIILFVLFIL